MPLALGDASIGWVASAATLLKKSGNVEKQVVRLATGNTYVVAVESVASVDIFTIGEYVVEVGRWK